VEFRILTDILGHLSEFPHTKKQTRTASSTFRPCSEERPCVVNAFGDNILYFYPTFYALFSNLAMISFIVAEKRLFQKFT
jgi:hypothetical protein